jgi:nucleoredoxin
MNKLFNEVQLLKGSLPSTGVVGLFFSAHWCPPCRGFTPKLAETYKKINEAGDKAFEIVFISSDKDQEQFDSYLAEMPWLALPFEQRDLKAKLSKMFKVNRIPSLVLLDAKTGAIISADGRATLSKDPTGEKYPWVPLSPLEALGSKFVTSSGESDGSAVKGKYVGIYFSAHWCRPCRNFTPKLAETYKKIKAARSDFEIVFCSADRDEDQFKEHFGTMPWIALPFADRDRADSLNGVCVILLCIPRFAPTAEYDFAHA